MTLVAPPPKMTKEEQEENLVLRLLHSERFVLPIKNGVDLLFINTMYPNLHICTPWDLFAFCEKHNIWIQAIRFSDGYRYKGIRIKEVTITTIE